MVLRRWWRGKSSAQYSKTRGWSSSMRIRAAVLAQVELSNARERTERIDARELRYFRTRNCRGSCTDDGDDGIQSDRRVSVGMVGWRLGRRT